MHLKPRLEQCRGGVWSYLLLHPLSCSSLRHDHFRASVKHHPRCVWKRKRNTHTHTHSGLLGRPIILANRCRTSFAKQTSRHTSWEISWGERRERAPASFMNPNHLTKAERGSRRPRLLISSRRLDRVYLDEQIKGTWQKVFLWGSFLLRRLLWRC